MSYAYTDYHHLQSDGLFLSPLPMPSPNSCWYPQRQDIQFGYSYPRPEPVPPWLHQATKYQQLTSYEPELYSRHQTLTATYELPPYASFDSGVNNTGWPPPPIAPAQMPEPYHHRPSQTPEPDIPYSHYQPSEEQYPPVYNGEGYSSKSFNYIVDDYLPYTDSWQSGPSCGDPPPAAFEQPPNTYTESYAYNAESQQQQAYSPLYPQPRDPPDWQPYYDQNFATSTSGQLQPDPAPPLESQPVQQPPDLEPNLSVAALVSQLERLTADVEQLVSQMDANERRLGDPHAATRPPPAPPFSLHDSAAPYTVQPHINPDIAGNLQQPPTQRSPPWNHDIRYGSIESLADDIHAHESVQSRQIHYLSDQLLNRDPIGDEDAENVLHSSVDVSGSIYGSKDDIYVSCNVVFARREPTHVVEHNGVDITMLSNKIDSCLLKEDEDGSIEEVKKVIACVYGVWHVGNVLGINHRSTFLDADARLIPPCIGFIDCSATPLPTPLELDEPTLTAQRWARLLWKILFRFRLSAKHGSCAFDPGGSTSQNFAREWKTIEAYVLRVLPQVTIIGVHPFDTNAKALLLHLDRRVELDQAGGFFDGVVIEIDKEIFRLCSKELTEGMGLVSHSAICTSLNDMFEEIGTIFKLFLAKAESFCTHYSLKDANVVVVPTGADMNFSRLGLIIAPEDAVQLYLRLASPMMETRQHQERHEVFHDNLISELHSLLVSWFPP